jgi:hypothetical protein
MDRRAEVLLDRFAAAADNIADEIAEASMREVPAFEAMDDARLREEIRALAAQHVRAFTLAARTGYPWLAQLDARALNVPRLAPMRVHVSGRSGGTQCERVRPLACRGVCDQ